MPTTLFEVIQDFAFPSGESGQYSYWVADAGGTAVLADAIAYANAFNTSLGAATAFKALFPSTLTIVPPKVAEVAMTTGVTIATGTGASNWSPTGANSATMPPQLAIVVTLVTAFAGGRHRGRMYFPGPIATTLGVTGRFTTGNATTVANAVAAAFIAGTTAVASLTPVVYSRLDRATTGVTEVSVGDVIDTQRRRRDKLLEVRSFAAV